MLRFHDRESTRSNFKLKFGAIPLIAFFVAVLSVTYWQRGVHLALLAATPPTPVIPGLVPKTQGAAHWNQQYEPVAPPRPLFSPALAEPWVLGTSPKMTIVWVAASFEKAFAEHAF